MEREKIMESMHMVGVELGKKPEKTLTSIGGRIMNELIIECKINSVTIHDAITYNQ